MTGVTSMSVKVTVGSQENKKRSVKDVRESGGVVVG